MTKQGFIKLHRQIQNHWLYDEKRKFSKFEAWVDMLMMANHKDNKFVLGNDLIDLKRGEFVTSELKLMERWGWGKAKLRSFLDLLQKDEMIVKKSDRKKTVINICNYNVYHDYETENRPQADHKQTTSRLLSDTNKNVKNDKNEKKSNYSVEFESFWEGYPRKADKKGAFEKFKQAIKRHDPEIVIQGAKAYAKECELKGTEKQYIKYAKTFLHNDSFLNEFETKVNIGSHQKQNGLNSKRPDLYRPSDDEFVF